MELHKQIEAVLFHKAEPMKIAKLAALLKVSADDINAALPALSEHLAGGGTRLITVENSVMLGTAPEVAPLIEEITKEELNKDIGKAGLETLTIVLYKGPLTRSEIDHIRGVNSNFILRNLLVRGLVEKIPNPDDHRSFLYKPTFELFQYLSITTREELPEFDILSERLEEFIVSEKEEEHAVNTEEGREEEQKESDETPDGTDSVTGSPDNHEHTTPQQEHEIDETQQYG